MFAKIASRSEETHIDPPTAAARFGDPLAEKTSWLPLKPGGANFKTNILKEIHPGRLEFRASGGMKIFSGIFAVIGISVLAVKLAKFPPHPHKEDWFLLAFGALFALVGLGMLFFGSIPAVFDKHHGYYAKTLKKPEGIADISAMKNHTKLNRIHAIQLISEFCSGDKSRYYSYELNLVLEDGSRLNVIDHGNVEAIRADAQKLAAFLGKPLWDAI